jgi:aspartyl aminopeptidase
VSTDPVTLDLLDYVHASPSPRHCVVETVRRLDAAGFEEISEGDAWSLGFGDARYLIRGGTVLAFRVGSVPAVEGGFRLIGAHTDSPNLRIKPVPDVSTHGYQQLGIETYGGLLDYTWLDRDLGLAGGVVIRDGEGALTTRLVRVDQPILRIPSLAIHLNREVREKGLKLNAQTHLQPILGLADGEDDVSALTALLADKLGVDAAQIVSWDLSIMDVVPPTVGGLRGEFIFCPRMDNQVGRLSGQGDSGHLPLRSRGGGERIRSGRCGQFRRGALAPPDRNGGARRRGRRTASRDRALAAGLGGHGSRGASELRRSA